MFFHHFFRPSPFLSLTYFMVSMYLVVRYFRVLIDLLLNVDLIQTIKSNATF